jgi:hypothetical protein
LFWILALVSRVSTYVFPSPSLFLIYLFSDLWILATIRTSVLESCFPRLNISLSARHLIYSFDCRMIKLLSCS